MPSVPPATEELLELRGVVEAIHRSQAVIEFALDGTVLTANQNFLDTTGYALDEVRGKHHRMFCEPALAESAEYAEFWERLAGGAVQAGTVVKRLAKGGREVWLRSSYIPICDRAGRPVKVIALATETQDNARQGVEALRASLEAIALIQKSSNSITEIVRVMGEIANQTNLLAFNASIEAARAGEHGVGFSIVAGEVRKLAERSFEAAQQIGTLIDESAERVQQGSEVSRRAESAFERIVGSVSRTNEAIRSISESTREQQETSRAVDALIAQLARTES